MRYQIRQWCVRATPRRADPFSPFPVWRNRNEPPIPCPRGARLLSACLTFAMSSSPLAPFTLARTTDPAPALPGVVAKSGRAQDTQRGEALEMMPRLTAPDGRGRDPGGQSALTPKADAIDKKCAQIVAGLIRLSQVDAGSGMLPASVTR